MNKLTLVIMAAGKGSRYGGAKQTDSLGLQGESIMDFTIYDAILAGFNHFIFIIQEEQKDYFQHKYENLSATYKIDYAIQDILITPFDTKKIERTKPWGTSHALWSAKDFIDAPFCVLNADDYYGRRAFLKMANFLTHNKVPQKGALLVYPLMKTMSEYGSVSRGCCTVLNNKLQLITEVLSIRVIDGIIISDTSDIMMDTPVSMNMWGLMPEALSVLEKKLIHFVDHVYDVDLKTVEALLPKDIQTCIKDQTIEIEVIDSEEDWFGVTYKEDKVTASNRLQKMQMNNYYPTPLFKFF